MKPRDSLGTTSVIVNFFASFVVSQDAKFVFEQAKQFQIVVIQWVFNVYGGPGVFYDIKIFIHVVKSGCSSKSSVGNLPPLQIFCLLVYVIEK